MLMINGKPWLEVGAAADQTARNNLFHISGTDIVRCLSFRFQAFGRPVKNSKKFEEGIFSDLRNLKSGTDASLEEPKSPFLDFLYKNNCIRTQKKQKVFYWYSVPHDRLFLDALERDLKREKMNQEATTVAVSEPALSFEFDSSQSLFEQLTKAQQANSSSFSANQSYSQSTSPVLRAVDSMPPPPMVPQALPTVAEDQQGLYGAMTMQNNMTPGMMKREPEVPQSMAFDRNGMQMSRAHQRHASMPTYMEYSPAPSFVSSQFEDYSRGISYEPVTPPQQPMSLGPEPTYVANEDTGLYSVLPEMNTNYNPMAQLGPANMGGPQFSTSNRSLNSNSYSTIEGSPTYKQRRRRSSIPTASMGMIAANGAANQAQAHTAHRPSDLRRSMSNAVLPLEEGDETPQDSPPDLVHSYPSSAMQSKEMHHPSRQGTPLPSLEESPAHAPMSLISPQDTLSNLINEDMTCQSLDVSPAPRQERLGPVRRARSATLTDMGPYSSKSHSCPIPSCGRPFKRLEHLKRYVIAALPRQSSPSLPLFNG